MDKTITIAKDDLSFIIDIINENWNRIATRLRDDSTIGDIERKAITEEKQKCYRLMNELMNIKVNYQPIPLNVADIKAAYSSGEFKGGLVSSALSYYANSTLEERWVEYLEIAHPALIEKYLDDRKK